MRNCIPEWNIVQAPQSSMKRKQKDSAGAFVYSRRKGRLQQPITVPTWDNLNCLHGSTKQSVCGALDHSEEGCEPRSQWHFMSRSKWWESITYLWFYLGTVRVQLHPLTGLWTRRSLNKPAPFSTRAHGLKGATAQKLAVDIVFGNPVYKVRLMNLMLQATLLGLLPGKFHHCGQVRKEHWILNIEFSKVRNQCNITFNNCLEIFIRTYLNFDIRSRRLQDDQ